MLTLFACPKPFTNSHIAIIQHNAIKSWTLLRPKPEIFLCGDESGVAETCKEFGLNHLTDIARNEFGTPLLNDIFKKVQEFSRQELLAYVNADIILLNDFMEAVQKVGRWFDRFLIFGARWDIEMSGPYHFDHSEWEKHLRDLALRSRVPGPLPGLGEYFVFRKGWPDLPAFAIGRTAFDNWFIYCGRTLGIPVIDATPSIMAIHQKHDYSHHPQNFEGVWKGEEAQRNQRLAGGPYACQFGVYDATHLLTLQGLKRALGWKYFRRAVEKSLVKVFN